MAKTASLWTDWFFEEDQYYVKTDSIPFLTHSYITYDKLDILLIICRYKPQQKKRYNAIISAFMLLNMLRELAPRQVQVMSEILNESITRRTSFTVSNNIWKKNPKIDCCTKSDKTNHSVFAVTIGCMRLIDDFYLKKTRFWPDCIKFQLQ